METVIGDVRARVLAHIDQVAAEVAESRGRTAVLAVNTALRQLEASPLSMFPGGAEAAAALRAALRFHPARRI